MGVLFVTGILVIAIVVGAISNRFAGPDNAIEELSEVVVEDQLESLLGLENDELKGKIDISPASKENN